MQCKDINIRPILQFLVKHPNATMFVPFENSVTCAFPPGCPPKLVLAKMKSLIKRGFVDGCMCGCGGDFCITNRGKAHLMLTSPIQIRSE